MPVKFKGWSEYKDNYPEFQSYKSAAFKPSPEQAAPIAGLRTSQTAVLQEPPIQRRKKIQGPSVSLSTDLFKPGDVNFNNEYALLGQQDKFASNVQYKPKSGFIYRPRSGSEPRQTKTEKEKPDESTKLKPAPVVSTHQFAEPNSAANPPTPLAPRGTKQTQTQLQKKEDGQMSDKENEPPAKKQVLQRTRTAAVKTSGGKKAAEVRKSEVTESMEQDQRDEVKKGLKDKNLSDVLGEMKKKKPSMNEFAQTNLEKGVADSAPEAPVEYAMKYRAGVAPPRPARKQSTYQREFDWKKRVAASPMLAADQVVYQSRVAPVKTSSFPKASEYKSQFKKWHVIENEPVPAVKRATRQLAATKNRALKRSKSVGADDSRKPLRMAVDDQELSDREEEKCEVPKPQPHHGKLRKVQTEYAANFKSPQKFKCKKGAWKGADPPQLLAQKPEVDPKKDDSAPALSNWFAEVLELRRKAAEYKKRAQGTHFSREHLVQLLAKQAQMWDIPTARSSSCSTLSALSLETGSVQLEKQTRKQRKNRKENLYKNAVDLASCKATIADSEYLSEDATEMAQEYEDEKVTKKAPRMAWIEDNVETEAADYQLDREDDYESAGSPSLEVVQEGRLPTPLWRKTRSPMKPRHHLDRTTPAVGGALLSSPPQPTRIKSLASGSSDTWDEESERKHFGKTYNLSKLKTTPTFGHPSFDTHMLRDDEASVDRPLKTNYVFTPEPVEDQEDDQEESVAPAPVKRQSRRKENMRPAGLPSTIHEEFGDTYNKPTILNLPKHSELDDDSVSLSTSIRSIASSCSLANNLYQRAKQRNDNFWTR